jgi:uncharacterized membrane protein
VSESVNPGQSPTKRRTALWIAVTLVLLAGIGFSWNPTPLAQGLAAIFIGCALLHAVTAYGLRVGLSFFAVCVAISLGIENLGAATGFPFGRYHFEVGANLPRIGLIPIIVGPLWFGAGYFSFVVAATLLDDADRRLDRLGNVIALPVVAAFVVTQWDLVMEPPNATIAKAWIWHDGGALFGVPISNYFGWLLTSWLFFQAFVLILVRHGRDAPAPSRPMRAVAILFYVSAGLTHVIPWILGQSGEVADATGHVWRIQDIREASVATFIFTMLFTGLLAGLRLFRPRAARRAVRG